MNSFTLVIMQIKGASINESEKLYERTIKTFEYAILKFKSKFNYCMNNFMSFLHSILNKNIYLLNLVFIPDVVNAHGMGVTETVFINWWVILSLNFIIFVTLFFYNRIIVSLFYLFSFLTMLFLFLFLFLFFHLYMKTYIDVYFYINGYVALIIVPLLITYIFTRVNKNRKKIK